MEGEEHTLMCKYNETEEVTWRVNNLKLQSEIYPPGFSLIAKGLPGGRVSILMVVGHLELNKTTIECLIILSDETELSILNVTLLIQGHPLISVT